MHNRIWNDYITYKRHQAFTRSIGHMTHMYPPKPLGINDFYGNHYYTFRSPTASFAALFDAAYKGFVYFNIYGELLTFCIYHRHTKALEHSPSNPIFCAKRALQRLSRQTVLSCTHVPRSFELKWCRLLRQVYEQ